jgi:hypothetical protein
MRTEPKLGNELSRGIKMLGIFIPGTAAHRATGRAALFLVSWFPDLEGHCSSEDARASATGD